MVAVEAAAHAGCVVADSTIRAIHVAPDDSTTSGVNRLAYWSTAVYMENSLQTATSTSYAAVACIRTKAKLRQGISSPVAMQLP